MVNIDRRRYLQLTGSVLAGFATMSPGIAAETIQANDARTGNNACKSLLSHRLRPLMAPDEQSLCEHYSGQVLLIVNTASQCGFTPQFADLETLHQRYLSRGFQVLGFPSADFRQELASESEVAKFCEINYGVSFPMFQKINVTGESAHPLYQDLARATGTYPRWNFNKYLIGRDAQVVAHYHSSLSPLDSGLVQTIESLL